mgnify:CR=1 FL=1
MKHYRKPSSVYIELEDSVPVSETLVQVSQRPSKNHTFSDNWQSGPMNPEVCWRLKTSLELDAEKEKSALADPVLKMAGAAILEAVFDMKQNPANYPTAASLKQKALELYKARL